MSALTDLRDDLTTHITQDKRLVLGSETIQESDITELMRKTLSSPQLSLSNVLDPTLSIDGNRLTLGGVATLLNLEAVAVTGLFFLKDNQVAFTLLVTLPSGWTFSRSFPELAGLRGVSILDETKLTNAQLIMASVDHVDQQLNLKLSEGLNFTGLVALDGPFALISELVPFKGQARISGSIGLVEASSGEGKLPSISIAASIGTEIKAGPVAIRSISLELGSLVYTSDQESATKHFASWAGLRGALQLGRTNANVAATIPQGSTGPIRFTADFAKENAPSLTQLAALVGVDLNQVIPASLQQVAGIFISSLEVCLSLRSKEILSVSFQLESPGAWKIIDQIIEVSDFEARVVVTDPTRSAARKVAATLVGGLNIGAAALQVKAELPEGAVSAWLINDEPLTAAAALTKFFPNLALPDFFGSFAIPQLQLTANRRYATWSVFSEIAIGSDLRIGDGRLVFGIQTMSFSIDSSPVSSSINFSGELVLFDKTFIVSVDREVEKAPKTPPAATWTFKAGLKKGESMTLTDLLIKVTGAGNFSLSLPAAVSSSSQIGTDPFRNLQISALAFSLRRASAKNIRSMEGLNGGSVWPAYQSRSRRTSIWNLHCGPENANLTESSAAASLLTKRIMRSLKISSLPRPII